MSFSLNGVIDTASYNNLIEYGVASGAGININDFYNVGLRSYGFGQLNPLAIVNSGDKITSLQWSNAVSRVAAMANHMGVTINATDPTAVNDVIKYDADYYNNLTPLNANIFSAVAQGTSSSLTGTCTSTWKQSCYFDHVITFPNGDNARYFFNAGGQIKLTYSSPAGPSYTLNYLMNQLALDVGTVVISAPSMSEYLPNGVKIAGTMYKGITQIAPRVAATTINDRLGYYGLYSSASVNFTNINTLALEQKARVGLTTYLNSNLQVRVMSNGTQGANQDNGNIITIRSLFDEVPDGGIGDSTIAAGTTATCTVVQPSTTYLAKSWGTPTITVTFVAT